MDPRRTKRWPRFALAALVAAPAAFGQAAVDGKAGLTMPSGNSLYNVRMFEPAPGQCRLEVRREQEPLWQLEKCVGTVDDLFLVSSKGDRVWVLYTLPREPASAKVEPRRGRLALDPLAKVMVAAEFDSKGTRVATRSLKQLQPAMERDKLQRLGAHFKWLEGVLGVPGRRPRSTEQNKVEFETMGPHTVHLNF